MPSSCRECGSSNVVRDDLYSQTQWVCEDCGTVSEEGHLTTTLSEEAMSRSVPYYLSTEASKTPCRNLLAGFSRVRALCRILRLSSNMEAEAVSFFERAYNHPNFLRAALMKKEILGGCCILFVCRQGNWPIAMGTISYLLGTDSPSMGPVYQELTKSLNIKTTTQGITDLLESFCYEFKLRPEQVDEVLSETPQQLVDRTSALIEVAAEAWIVTGRHPLPLLMAAVYVAWQSLNPKARMKYTFSAFCQIGKAPEQAWRRSKDTVMKRLSELREVLCKLGRQLPWLRGNTVEPNTVATLVDDILKNHRVLLLRAVRNYEEQLQNEPLKTESTPSPGTTHDENDTDPPKVTDPDQVENAPDKETSDTELPPNHWGKRHLFLPPCVKNCKRQRVDEPQMEVTGDEDISDSEIESYIRSQAEINMYLRAQNELEEA
ncbi:transcription factor IIIB 50 kDa subunit [Triplophysa rosa]|uniref:Transcription factor IIIB 50 kDa subunit n=1 Tax=Triplophysa rosa TaxID=992332 RepID=A0A9W7TA87_TRIRA|nr:transcription factor IIIB 50 kDa subunit [Triplophysa rosa]KAI7793490.1 putative transcription factor IIIB 50 kDa subunit [Triplophysa rosa]